MNLYINPINHVKVDEFDELFPQFSKLFDTLDRNTSCINCLHQSRWLHGRVCHFRGLINVNITSGICIPICEHWRCKYETIY